MFCLVLGRTAPDQALVAGQRRSSAAQRGRTARGNEEAAHPGHDAGLGDGRGGQMAVQSMAAELGACRGNGDVGVDSG
jgi:hypothetical protein